MKLSTFFSRASAVALAVAVGLALLPLSARAGGQAVRLSPGDSHFWTGPYIESSMGQSCDQAECHSYSFEIEPGGDRLRVAIDHPELQDVFEAEVYGPGGRLGSFSPGSDIYSQEDFYENPAPGRWRVVVRAESVTDSAFRVRAKLENSEPNLGPKNGLVLPNLQILPPHDASFMTPITNGAAGGQSMGVNLVAGGCHAEEHGEDGAIRCLRFSYGVRNTGLGPMDLQLGTGNQLERELIQRIYRANGTFVDRSAGIARYHKTHAHFHHHDAIGLRLYRVTDRKAGKLEAASDKRMKGFAHRNELLREWNHFYPTWTMTGFGLLPGWSDIYEWDRPGNYIDFGLNGDGFYVVRMWADPVRGVRESNERDNTGYTYMKVTGAEVELIQAGRGTDPWDPCKIIVGFGGHPDPPRQPRLAGCPPDST